MQEIEDLGIKNQTCVQSFDVRPLQELHRLDPAVTTALLVENPNGVQVNLDALGYTPDIYSPYYKMVTGNVVETVHDLGMAIIPWTVNDTTAMKALIGLGVDGIITDYPNKTEATKVKRGITVQPGIEWPGNLRPRPCRISRLQQINGGVWAYPERLRQHIADFHIIGSKSVRFIFIRQLPVGLLHPKAEKDAFMHPGHDQKQISPIGQMPLIRYSWCIGELHQSAPNPYQGLEKR